MPEIENSAEEAPATAVVADAPAPEVEGDWKSAVIVAGGRIPSNVGRRKVIVVEQRTDGEPRTSGYPREADAYLRIDPSVEFPKDAAVYTLGENLKVSGTGGFSRRGVRQGPHLAYAAANLAWTLGATKIEITGLTKAEQEAMQPWLESPKMPDGVTVTLS